MRLTETASASWLRRAVATAALVVLVGYGVLWLAARAIRPYQEWSKSVECRRNVHILVRGFNMYADDYDGRYLPAERWEDCVEPYAPPKYRRCPSAAPDAAGAGYAADLARSGAERIKLDDESMAALLYDSAQSVRNAAGRQQDMPVPGRHITRRRQERASVRGNWIGYADGSCRLKPDDNPGP